MRTLIIIIIIIVVVVVVDDDTDYWVYLSTDHLFQVYYKVRQVLLQSATAFLLQSVTILLQSATGITKCDSTHARTHEGKKERKRSISTPELFCA